jgi:hypothetical protein
MAPGKRPTKDNSGKIHPLFIELYLSNDSDGSDDTPRERRARPRRSALKQRVNWRS